MRFATSRIAAFLLIAAIFADGTVVCARSPVLPIPSARQPQSILAPKSGVPKMQLPAPSTKGAKKKSWFPFGNRNKKVRSR